MPDANLGYGAANNLGIKKVKTKYLLILNPDTILLKDTLEQLLYHAKKIENFAILGPKILEGDNIENKDSKLDKSAKLISNWISTELFSLLNKDNLNISNSPVNPENLGQLVKLVITNVISGKIAKEVLVEMYSSQKSAIDIVEQKGLKQMTDTSEIKKIIQSVLDDNNEMVSQYKSGKTKLLGFFVGQVMKRTKGKANPKLLNDLLIKMIN